MAPVFPEDRKRYGLHGGRQPPNSDSETENSISETENSISDNDSDDSVPIQLPVDDMDDIPGLGVPSSSSRIRDATVVLNTPDFRVTMAECGFKRQNKFRYEDHQFRIQFNKTSTRNRPAFKCMEIFREVIKTVVYKLRNKFRNQNCCYVWLTLLSADVPGGIPLGKAQDLLLFQETKFNF